MRASSGISVHLLVGLPRRICHLVNLESTLVQTCAHSTSRISRGVSEPIYIDRVDVQPVVSTAPHTVRSPTTWRTSATRAQLSALSLPPTPWTPATITLLPRCFPIRRPITPPSRTGSLTTSSPISSSPHTQGQHRRRQRHHGTRAHTRFHKPGRAIPPSIIITARRRSIASTPLRLQCRRRRPATQHLRPLRTTSRQAPTSRWLRRTPRPGPRTFFQRAAMNLHLGSSHSR